jgi:hypothetical protein
VSIVSSGVSQGSVVGRDDGRGVGEVGAGGDERGAGVCDATERSDERSGALLEQVQAAVEGLGGEVRRAVQVDVQGVEGPAVRSDDVGGLAGRQGQRAAVVAAVEGRQYRAAVRERSERREGRQLRRGRRRQQTGQHHQLQHCVEVCVVRCSEKH